MVPSLRLPNAFSARVDVYLSHVTVWDYIVKCLVRNPSTSRLLDWAAHLWVKAPCLIESLRASCSFRLVISANDL